MGIAKGTGRSALIAFLLWLYSLTIGFAQTTTHTISGKVADQSGEGLPYAVVYEAGTQQMATTDLQGAFALNGMAVGKHILITSYLGFESSIDTVEIIDGSVVLDIILQEKAELLNPVDITVDPHSVQSEEPLTFTLSGQTVSDTFLREHQGNTLMNSLEDLAGVSALNTGVGISKPVIRGMSFNRVIVNEYGIKQEGQQWGVEHGLELDQYGVHELELIKGPVSVLYGSDGLAGVINIKRPKLPKRDTLRADVNLNYKSNNALFGTSASVEKFKNNLWFKARITWQDFADYKVPANEFKYNSYSLPIVKNRLKNTAGNELNYAFHLGTRRKWGHSTLYVSRFGQQVGFFAGAFGIPKTYQLQDDGDSRDIQLPYQDIDHWKVISNTVVYGRNAKWMIDLGYQQNLRQEHSQPHAHGKGPAPEGTLALELRLQTLSYNVRWCYDLRPHWQLYIGSNGQRKTNQTSGFESLIPEYTAMQAGLYALQDLKLRKGLYWQLGLRWDVATQSAQETTVPVYGSDATISGYEQRNPAIEKAYSVPTVSSGVAWDLSKKTGLKYNVGTAFRFPTIPELASNGIHHGTFRHELGNPELDIEQGILQDVSWAYRSKKLTAGLSPFFYRFQNYIYLRPSAKFSTLPDAGQVYQYSEGPVTMTGLETTFQYAISKNWRWDFSVEYVWNKNTELGHPLPFTPPLHALNEVTYRFTLGKGMPKNWLRFSWNQFAPQNRVDLNEKTTDGYALFHLAGGMEFHWGKRTFQWQLQLMNLTNARYLNNMSRYRILNLPEQGRNVQVSVYCGF